MRCGSMLQLMDKLLMIGSSLTRCAVGITPFDCTPSTRYDEDDYGNDNDEDVCNDAGN